MGQHQCQNMQESEQQDKINTHSMTAYHKLQCSGYSRCCGHNAL
jgi:hypothetical protein